MQLQLNEFTYDCMFSTDAYYKQHDKLATDTELLYNINNMWLETSAQGGGNF